VDFLVHKNVTFKAGWNYYQYGESDFVGPTAPRYFHANNATLALRYAF
jgi:opacity protein-like surface antigen